MNRKNLLSVIVLLALCLGQLVSNAHVIGHLSESTGGHHHLTAFTDDLHWHPAHADHEQDHFQSDCTAYHILAGMAGLAPTAAHYLNGAWVGLPIVRPSQATLNVSWNVSPPPIRGPPILS